MSRPSSLTGGTPPEAKEGGADRRAGRGDPSPKVYFSMSVSADGFINGPDGEIDWHRVDDELFEHFIELDREAGWHVYGRRLYETMTYWETAEEEAVPLDPSLVREYARVWRAIPKLVVSNTLDSVGGDARLLEGDLGEAIRGLKSRSSGDISVGGATLAGSLTRLGLVDEFRRYVMPVVVGAGTPYFSPGIGRLDLELVETRRFGSGVVLERYRALSRSGP